ncbi:hypothetical protein GCM10010182_04110 [Actinomadura cremea]|nr:hypothetical protein GCM10010182_04110 [Actinomadura cremea]
MVTLPPVPDPVPALLILCALIVTLTVLGMAPGDVHALTVGLIGLIAGYALPPSGRPPVSGA